MSTYEMNFFRVNTTAFYEEDFFIMTTLTEDKVMESIQPIIDAEREGGEEYDNDMLIQKLKQDFPHDIVEHYSSIDTISL